MKREIVQDLIEYCWKKFGKEVFFKIFLNTNEKSEELLTKISGVSLDGLIILRHSKTMDLPYEKIANLRETSAEELANDIEAQATLIKFLTSTIFQNQLRNDEWNELQRIAERSLQLITS